MATQEFRELILSDFDVAAQSCAFTSSVGRLTLIEELSWFLVKSLDGDDWSSRPRDLDVLSEKCERWTLGYGGSPHNLSRLLTYPLSAKTALSCQIHLSVGAVITGTQSLSTALVFFARAATRMETFLGKQEQITSSHWVREETLDHLWLP